MESLAGELRFAGKGTLVRHLERIEGLAPGIEVDGVYPAEFLVFRVTGYRAAELGDGGLDVMVPGDAVLGDLSALGERLSEAAGLTVDDVGIEGEDYETIDSLGARWGVSRKTIERYRRLGLVGRRVDLGSGHRVVVFMNSAVGWFEERFADRIGGAAGFSRMSEAMRGRIVRDARRYVRRLGWNRSRVCTRIGQRIGRSGESIRRVLIEHDEGCERGDEIFDMKGSAGADEQMMMLRESLCGKRSGTIGARVGRSAMQVNRCVNRARRGLILDVGFGGGNEEVRRGRSGVEKIDKNREPSPQPSPIRMGEGGREEGAVLGGGVLDESVVCSGLNTRGAVDLAGLICELREQRAAVVYEQTARARAAAAIASRCDRLAGSLHVSTPSGRVLDEIETGMRWMVLLRIELIATQLSLMLSTIEERIGGPIDTLAPGRAVEILNEAIGVVQGVVERFDGVGDRRLAAPVGMAMARWCSRLDDVAVAAVEGKAGRRVVEGYAVEDWTAGIWGKWWWLRPVAVVGGLPKGMGDRDGEILVRRYGLGGERPWGLEELGEWLGTPAMHAGRMAQGALRRAHEKTAT